MISRHSRVYGLREYGVEEIVEISLDVMARHDQTILGGDLLFWTFQIRGALERILL